VVGSCEHDDEPLGSHTTHLVNLHSFRLASNISTCLMDFLM
jgi:hypothetical protein